MKPRSNICPSSLAPNLARERETPGLVAPANGEAVGENDGFKGLEDAGIHSRPWTHGTSEWQRPKTPPSGFESPLPSRSRRKGSSVRGCDMSEVDFMGNCRKCGRHLESTAGLCQCEMLPVRIEGTPAQPFKCPCCDGTGKVSRPPWVAGDVLWWPGGGAGELYDCKACRGSGVLWR